MGKETAVKNMNTNGFHEVLKYCSTILGIISILSKDHYSICLDITLQSSGLLHVRHSHRATVLSQWHKKIGI